MARILITSALPYINGVKHLGNLVGSQLPADVYARYCRARGHEVLYICATDEHGTPAELAAAEAGEPVADYCARLWAIQKELADGFRLSFDHFGRSSSPQNHRLTQHFAGRLADAGLIEEAAERQVYSVADGRFLPDRYIDGTCPHCGYPRARGDQCENCTKQLDPTDLIEPRSAISGSTDLEVRETKHLYLRQSLMRDELRALDRHQDRLAAALDLDRAEVARRRGPAGPRHHPRPRLGHPGPARRRALAGHGGQGLLRLVRRADRVHRRHRGVGRRERPRRGRLAALVARPTRARTTSRYVQFMGKDNVPFHTLGFPATILGSGEPWKLVDYIKGFN